MTAIACMGCGAVVDDTWSVCPACGADPRIGTPETGLDMAALRSAADEAGPTPAFDGPVGPSSAPGPSRRRRGAPPRVGEPHPSKGRPRPRTLRFSQGARSSSAHPGQPFDVPPEATQETRSWRRTSLRLLGIIVVLTLTGVGCWSELRGDKVDEYNGLSDRVVDLQAETVRLQGELEQSFRSDVFRPLVTVEAGRAELGDPSPAELAALQPALEQARGVVAERNARLVSLSALWNEMLLLDTGESRNTYCRQNRQIVELDRQMGAVLDQFCAKLEAAAAAPLSPADASRMQQEISALLAQLSTMQPRYAELVRAAWEYYSEEF